MTIDNERVNRDAEVFQLWKDTFSKEPTVCYESTPNNVNNFSEEVMQELESSILNEMEEARIKAVNINLDNFTAKEETKLFTSEKVRVGELYTIGARRTGKTTMYADNIEAFLKEEYLKKSMSLNRFRDTKPKVDKDLKKRRKKLSNKNRKLNRGK